MKAVSKHKATDSDRAVTLMFEMGRIIRQACIAAGDVPMPVAHVETLRFIEERKNPTMRDVAEYLRVTAPSATAIIDDLATQALLARTTDAHDRRVVRLSISKKGGALLAKNIRLKTNVLRGMVAKLDGSDERDLARILSKLVKA